MRSRRPTRARAAGFAALILSSSLAAAGDARADSPFLVPTLDLNPKGYSTSSGSGAALGQQVGYGYNVAAGGTHALLWNGSSTNFIDLNPIGLTTTIAYATDGPQQVGIGFGAGPVSQGSAGTGGQFHALLWNGSATNFVDLNPVGFTDSYARGVANGVEAGYGNVAGGGTHALLWKGSASSYTDLNPAGYSYSVAYATDGTQAVGFGLGGGASTGGQFHALLWKGASASQYVDLNPAGFTDSYAQSVAGGVQVGYGDTTGGATHALTWTGNAASAVDLNPAGYTSSVALATNGSKTVGYGNDANGAYHLLLWSGTGADRTVQDLSRALPDGFAGGEGLAVDAKGNVTGVAGQHAFQWLAPVGNLSISNVGSLSGAANGVGNALNAAGVIVGASPAAGGAKHAFVNAGQGVRDLGTLGGPTSEAAAVSDAGQVAGTSQVADGSTRAFRSTAYNATGAMPLLQALKTLGGSSHAADINNAGLVVGFSYLNGSTGAYHAFASDDGVGVNVHDLGTLGGANSLANAINSLGAVVGRADTVTPGVSHAFYLAPGSSKMTDLGSLGGPGAGSAARDVNDLGLIAGYSYLAPGPGGAYHAFLHAGGDTSITAADDLGTLGGSNSAALSVNDLGQAVGFSTTIGDRSTHAFFYDPSVGLLDLNTLIDPSSGWILRVADAINDAGQVTGYATDPKGRVQPFTLNVTGTPEPAGLSILALAAVGVLSRRRRKYGA